MAGRYDPNPFDDGEEVNPFAVSSLGLCFVDFESLVYILL